MMTANRNHFWRDAAVVVIPMALVAGIVLLTALFAHGGMQ